MNISAAGAVRLSNAAFPDSGAYIFSQQGQTIAANSLQMLGAAGGRSVGLQNDVGAQTITTIGSGPNGWGIELINNGSLDRFNQGVYLNTNSALQMTALDGGGILLDNKGGPVSIYSAGAQVILADGSGANAIELRGGPGETIINGASQTITAGTGANPGSIVLLGGSVRHSTAGIYYQTGTQRVSTTGQLRLIAGTAPDDGQGSKRCDVQGCANIGSVTLGADQVIAADSIVLQGGSDGGRNEANIFTAGNQSVTAPGGITILGGAGPGPGNWGSLAIINSPTAVQTVSFGAGGLTIRSSDTAAGDESTASVYADGAQAISGTGDILITGGLAGSRSYAQISAQTGRDITGQVDHHRRPRRPQQQRDLHSVGLADDHDERWSRRRLGRLRHYPAEPRRDRARSGRQHRGRLHHHAHRHAVDRRRELARYLDRRCRWAGNHRRRGFVANSLCRRRTGPSCRTG